MRMWSQRRSLMVRTPSDRYGVRAFTGLARPRPIRWWFRTGTWLAVLGITRLVYTVRARWRSMFLAAGALLVIIGVTLSSAGAFVPGLLVLLIGLTGGAERSHCRSADQMTGAHWHA